jgi:D-glycero-alpha-D-manno-heptose-7-phosphate kinase
MEVEELGWPGGVQDQMAAAFGGINIIPFGFEEELGAIPVSLDEETLYEFRNWMMIAFIGGKRHSKEQQKGLTEGMSEKRKQKSLIGLRRRVDEVVGAVKRRDWEVLGRIFDEAWEDKKRSNPSVTNETIDDYYETAKRLGMLGGKVMGSGGAGHLFMFVPPERQIGVQRVFSKKGARIIDFDFDFSGLETKIM